MTRRARACGFEGPVGGIGDMALVVWAIEVLAVPAALGLLGLTEKRPYMSMAYVGKVIVVRIPPSHFSRGR